MATAQTREISVVSRRTRTRTESNTVYRIAKREPDGHVGYVGEWNQYTNLTQHAHKPVVAIQDAKAFGYRQYAEQYAEQFNTVLRMSAHGRKLKDSELFFVEAGPKPRY